MYNSTILADMINVRAKEKQIQLKTILSEVGITDNTLTNLRKGSMLGADKLALIADYLNCSVDYLLGRTDNPNGVYQNSNSGNIVNGNNGDNSPLTVNGNARSDTEELVELIQGLPLVQRAKIITQIDEMKNKK